MLRLMATSPIATTKWAAHLVETPSSDELPDLFISKEVALGLMWEAHKFQALSALSSKHQCSRSIGVANLRATHAFDLRGDIAVFWQLFPIRVSAQISAAELMNSTIRGGNLVTHHVYNEPVILEAEVHALDRQELSNRRISTIAADDVRGSETLCKHRIGIVLESRSCKVGTIQCDSIIALSERVNLCNHSK